MSDKSKVSIQELARRMQDRRKEGVDPYVLLLGSSLSLTPSVLRAFAGTGDHVAFWEITQRLSPTELETSLREPLAARASKLEPGYQAIAQLAKTGYFDLILTLNVDDAIDDAVRPLPADQSVLLTYDGSNADKIVAILSRNRPRIKVIKLRGDINTQVLLLTTEKMFKFPKDLEQSISKRLEGDTILVGDISYDDDVQHCITQRGGALWCILPDKPASDSFIMRAKRGRQTGGIIIGADAEFNAFFTALAKLLNVWEGSRRKIIAVYEEARITYSPPSGSKSQLQVEGCTSVSRKLFELPPGEESLYGYGFTHYWGKPTRVTVYEFD